MTSTLSPPDNIPQYSPPSHIDHNGPDSELRAVIASAYSALDQSSPPSIREILGAYKSKGDGDRDMLLAILSAKSAEEQRIASTTALHRTILEAAQKLPEPTPLPPQVNGIHHHHHPRSYTQSPPQATRRVHHPTPSHTRSPPRTHAPVSSMREAPSHPPRKRQRSSHSPPGSHAVSYESHQGSQHEQLPPSPYSSSGSDSAEYSPRSRTSMAIGSLLSSGPNKPLNGDDSQNMNGHVHAHQNHLQP